MRSGLRRPRRRRMLARGSGALLAVALVLRVGIAGARTTPLKLSHPALAYLAASAVAAGARGRHRPGLAFAGAAAGAALGFLLGVGLEEASVLAGARPWRSQVRRWLRLRLHSAGVGFVRLASDGWSGWRTAAAAFVLVAFAVSWYGVALAAGADALLALRRSRFFPWADYSSSPSRRSPSPCLRRAWI
ncbi:MAG: hypothetical protein ACLT98_14180 [Eggerthellaceae bacterium]